MDLPDVLLPSTSVSSQVPHSLVTEFAAWTDPHRVFAACRDLGLVPQVPGLSPENVREVMLRTAPGISDDVVACVLDDGFLAWSGALAANPHLTATQVEVLVAWSRARLPDVTSHGGAAPATILATLYRVGHLTPEHPITNELLGHLPNALARERETRAAHPIAGVVAALPHWTEAQLTALATRYPANPSFVRKLIVHPHAGLTLWRTVCTELPNAGGYYEPMVATPEGRWDPIIRARAMVCGSFVALQFLLHDAPLADAQWIVERLCRYPRMVERLFADPAIRGRPDFALGLVPIFLRAPDRAVRLATIQAIGLAGLTVPNMVTEVSSDVAAIHLATPPGSDAPPPMARMPDRPRRGTRQAIHPT